MPKAFDDARRIPGAKIRTKSLGGGKYVRIVIKPARSKAGPRGGRTVAGEIKTRKGR